MSTRSSHFHHKISILIHKHIHTYSPSLIPPRDRGSFVCVCLFLESRSSTQRFPLKNQHGAIAPFCESIQKKGIKMEDFVEDCYVEIDEEYEFDASQFFDFTRPEVDSEIEEVERWFEISGNYPNSPFIVKLDLEKILPAPAVKSSNFRKSTKSIMSSSSDTNSRHGLPPKKNTKGVENAAKPKIKPPQKASQPRKSANFMEPTASHLAKQNAVQKQQSSKSCTRFQKATRTKLDARKTCTGFEIRATKRQKLETGFLKKGSYLKHKFSLSHKSSKEASVPREPELEPPPKSQRRRWSKKSWAPSETESQKQRSPPSKCHHPSNIKNLEARSLPRPRKSKTPLTEFQEFHFKTTERANHHSSAKENRSSSGGSSLTEEFNKLSLGSKPKRTSVSSVSSKSSSRSSRGSFQTELWQGPNQHCGAPMRPHQPNITSLS